MDAPSQPLKAAEGIRSLKSEDDIFKAFDSYPWTKDRVFMAALSAILGNPRTNNPEASLEDIATHARIFHYKQRIGVALDFARYSAWLAANPAHQPPDVLPVGLKPEESPPPVEAAPKLDWQESAPKANLFVDKNSQEFQSAGDEGQPTYPSGFAEMIRLLQEGKPVPGIRAIPNTVVRDPSIKPVGSKTVPRKPWERQQPSVTSDLDINQALDTDFPDPDDNVPEERSKLRE